MRRLSRIQIGTRPLVAAAALVLFLWLGSLVAALNAHKGLRNLWLFWWGCLLLAPLANTVLAIAVVRSSYRTEGHWKWSTVMVVLIALIPWLCFVGKMVCEWVSRPIGV